jgi:hypothetical protein
VGIKALALARTGMHELGLDCGEASKHIRSNSDLGCLGNEPENRASREDGARRDLGRKSALPRSRRSINEGDRRKRNVVEERAL